MNERITENIVRDHFKADPLFSQATVEEQKSKNPRIEKLLQMASKSGAGRGRPEFLITFPSIRDFLIVIECKADAKWHESPKRDRYGEFAVDGALLYASYLIRDFDVLAIAVSGQSAATAKISHFEWRQGKASATEQKRDKQLLSLQSYLATYKDNLAAAHIEGLKVTEKAVEYNETLNDYSIPETERATFISAVLVALQDAAFRKSYGLLETPSDLAAAIIEATQRVLTAHRVDAERQGIILSQYRTIQNQDVAKSATVRKAKAREQVPNTILRDITRDIEKHVFPLTSGGQRGYDVLGRFYTEFIRYSGSDARTGLVLTPQHITQLFCDLVNLTPDDIVLDPCCGTGGFLTAAMQYMWERAGNNQAVREKIKTERLIGIERRVDMFTHACSNMMMRGDGKSNIFRGDCFDPALRDKIIKHHPTVALLNPPYDVKPAGQLDFVANALDMLDRGRCAAIVQMSAAIDQKKDIILVRERLLKQHTLEAVLSMPNDVFYPAGPVTCVLVFRAKQAHPDDYKTYFGYWRDDGFIKRKHKGRISDGTWPETKRKMLASYINRESQPGFSVLRHVTASDEWCAEAYLEADYSQLNQDDYDREIKRYALFNLMLDTDVKLDEQDEDA